MSKKQQIEKNIKLTSKLAFYLANNPEVTKEIPSGSSYVAISLNDRELNARNTKLIENLIKAGKKVVKAIQQPKNKWDIHFITP